jgi:hypothetical protein
MSPSSPQALFVEKSPRATDPIHVNREYDGAAKPGMSVAQFFQSYARVLNRSLGERDGLDAIRAHLADALSSRLPTTCAAARTT